MMKLQILNTRDVKELKKIISDVWGVDFELEVVFLKSEKRDRIYAVNRDIADIDLSKLRIDTLGLYFGTWNVKGFRLSFEGSRIIGPLAKKNVAELNEKQRDEWIKGQDIEFDSSSKEFLIIKCGADYFGCGKMREGMLYNFVPKTRRLSVVAD
ncbi:hypothetical protein KY335_00950 [Candidatus Woesearchaeota archaeon]|nr:hypothetical protein [Candidatus Woesearchaeota archaeon]